MVQDNYLEIYAMGTPAMQQPLRKEQHAATPNQAFDLRSTLEWLRASGELIETDREVDPDLQVTGLQKHMDGGCPVLFNNVKGKPNHRVITNLFGDMAIINRMFGWKDDAERVKQVSSRTVASDHASRDRPERSAMSGIRRREARRRQ